MITVNVGIWLVRAFSWAHIHPANGNKQNVLFLCAIWLGATFEQFCFQKKIHIPSRAAHDPIKCRNWPTHYSTPTIPFSIAVPVVGHWRLFHNKWVSEWVRMHPWFTPRTHLMLSMLIMSGRKYWWVDITGHDMLQMFHMYLSVLPIAATAVASHRQ